MNVCVHTYMFSFVKSHLAQQSVFGTKDDVEALKINKKIRKQHTLHNKTLVLL